MLKVHLLVIDPQNDFCDPSTGALYVKGAEKDMDRTATMVKRVGPKLTRIHATLDSHHSFDIGHPIYWKDSSGNHPDPFTIITVADMESGKWSTTQASSHRRTLDYLKALEAGGRYPCCIWPPHCLIGTSGHAVWPALFGAFVEWEGQHIGNWINYVTKGSNPYTEHYSAVKAEVPDTEDPTTQINTKFISLLEDADLLPVAGEASTHCLANTLRDTVNAFGNPESVKKVVLLEDATSPVPTFEKYYDDFVSEMMGKGMQVTTTDKFLA